MSRGIVLLVDDDPRHRLLYTDFLEAKDFTVFSAADGADALRVLHRVKPKVVLMDVMMPGLSGIETCRRIRQIGDLNTVPIIFLTALEYAEHLREGLVAGADDYVLKSGRMRDVLERINYWCMPYSREKSSARRSKAIEDVEIFLEDNPIDSVRPRLKWRNDPIAVELTQFLERALSVAGKDFGKTQEHQLYFLGYVAGVVDHEVSSHARLKPDIKKYIRGALRTSGLMDEEQIQALVESIERVSADEIARAGWRNGRRDKGAADAAGEDFIPRGLMEIKVLAA